MSHSKKIPIEFLVFFHELLGLKFDEKSAIKCIKSLHSPYKSLCDAIYSKLISGLSFYQIINENERKPWVISSTISNLDLSSWLEYKIKYLQEIYQFKKDIKKILLSPCLLILFSLALNIYLVLVFVPKIQSMLVQFNAPVPGWIVIIQHVSQFTHTYALPIAITGICIIFILKTIVFKALTKLLYPIVLQLFVIDLFAVITPLLNQGIDLKTIIKEISISKNKSLASTYNAFRESLLCSEPYEKSFSILISNKSFINIIIQSLATNKLDYGLSKVSDFYRTYHKLKVTQLAMSLKVIAFFIIGINILIGFYLTILPMNQIITKLLS